MGLGRSEYLYDQRSFELVHSETGGILKARESKSREEKCISTAT